MAGTKEEEARTLYVGGLANGVDADILGSVFSTFGEVQTIEVVPNSSHAFVCFEEEEDSHAAQANMHHAELFGKILTVAPAQRTALKPDNKPIWESAEYFAAREAQQRSQGPEEERPRGVQSEGDGFNFVHIDDEEVDDEEDEEGTDGKKKKKPFFVPADLAKDEAEGRRLI